MDVILKSMASYLSNLNLFDSTTRERGKSYFRSGKVLSIKQDGLNVAADVLGSYGSSYKVKISFLKDGHTVNHMSCTCPCSFPCKHEAALLYELEDKDKNLTVDGSKIESARVKGNYLSTLSNLEDYEYEIESLVSELSFYRRNMTSIDAMEVTALTLAKLIYFITVDDFSFASDYIQKTLEDFTLNETDYEIFFDKVFSFNTSSDFGNYVINLSLSNEKLKKWMEKYLLKLFYKDEKELKKKFTEIFTEGLGLSDAHFDPDFALLLLKIRPKNLQLDLIESALKEIDIEKNKYLIRETLISLSKNDFVDDTYFDLFKRFYDVFKDKNFAFEISKNILEVSDFFGLLFSLHEVLSWEDLKTLILSMKYRVSSHWGNIAAFLFYPALGEISYKSDEMFFTDLFRHFSILNDQCKERVKIIAEQYLLKKAYRKAEYSSIYSAFGILINTKEINVVLSLVDDARFNNIWKEKAGKALLLNIKEQEKDDYPHIIFYQGEKDVSL